MVKFAWDTEKSCADILVDLAEADIDVGDTMFLANVVDSDDWTVYAVVVYTTGEELFPDGYDEAQATEEFLKLLHTVVTIGV